ncbi:MAG TPA: haloalkane dehalogenase [Gammaproteobacteria bacterium]|nr:haloalkane dehalogenase [Gammaproteobacteria bacterium]MDP6733005.1 haloalkane dehalogenase [Gammaproteobacteria bacterium]HAJ75563.1 haloalkane dehalogenase [Gammaproteobacteria bacterium]
MKPGVFRTPDARFDDLPGFDFEANYQYIDGYRIHYLDEGPVNGPVVLLLHGEPSWSYLYRKMIPVFVDAGYRTVVPDLLGFGKSDKPANRATYSYQGQVDIINQLVSELDLNDMSAFFQDWGGLVGLRVVAENPERFLRVAIGNTGFPVGPGEDGIIIGTQFASPNSDARLEPGSGFLQWLRYSQEVPVLDASFVVQWGTVSTLAPEVLAAYAAPFPDSRYMAGARVMPTLVQSQIATNRAAWAVLQNWQKPFLTTFSDSDPITNGGDQRFQQAIAGASGQNHTTIQSAGHFLQEDKGEELASYLVSWFLE